MALIDCPECATEVSSAAPSCPKCGFPIASSLKKQGQAEDAPVLRDGGPVLRGMLGDDASPDFPVASELGKQAEPQATPEARATESRQVSFLLAVGIFWLPLIFAWFTLRRGYSTKARAISFGWPGIVAIFALSKPDDGQPPGESLGDSWKVVKTATPEPEPEPPPEPKWYEGGTLHKAKVSQWVSATERNRVATCADFAATFIMNKSSTSLQRAYDAGVEFDGHDGGMKYAAGALCVCLNEATTDLPKKAQWQTISDMAAMCVVLMDAQL